MKTPETPARRAAAARPPLAQVMFKPGVGQLPIGLDVLRAIRRPLFQSAASLDRQLAALVQRCGGGGGGAGRNLPTAVQLQIAWAALATTRAPAGLRFKVPEADLAALCEEAARDLQALQPDTPRSSFELGIAAHFNSKIGSASCLRDALPYFTRGAELARAQGSDFWLARWAGWGGLGRLLTGGPGPA